MFSNKNLGGFPNIIYLNKEEKKIREFKKLNENNNVDQKKLNILNIKDILNSK